jgi:hypothetical protein
MHHDARYPSQEAKDIPHRKTIAPNDSIVSTMGTAANAFEQPTHLGPDVYDR